MKRKVNLVGQNTLTVSLPVKWAKEHNLTKGDEIDIIESEGSLVLNTNSKSRVKEITLDVSDYGNMVGRVVGAVYKAGYDRVKLTYDDEDILKLIQKELSKGFIGVDIINHSKGYCILESMASIQAEELDNALRRLFRLLIENASDSLTAALSKNYAELDAIAYRDLNVNKFSDFTRRLLNKFGYTNPEKTSLYYFVAEDLENIGDEYKNICRYIVKNKATLSKKLSKIYEDTNKFLIQFYELFYNFSAQTYSEFGKSHQQLVKDIESQYLSLNNKELVVLLKLESVVTSVFDLNGPLITLKI